MEQTYKIRRRVNFSVSVKGIVTPECTFEEIDGTLETAIKGAKELLEEALKIATQKSKELGQAN